ncbi:MAG: sulfotransferase family protein [Candidatus Omnitrophota bacterium]
MKQELYLHIGYPKTGTTFLQSEVFPKAAGLNYVNYLDMLEDISKILKQDEYSFNADKVREVFEKRFRPGKNLLSQENFVGDFYRCRLLNSKLVADRLKRLFPEARIIITLRNQYDLIESLYRQYLQSGGLKKFREFVGFDGDDFEESYLHWGLNVNIGNFNFLNPVRYYESLFGKDRLLVLPYELLKRDPGAFMRKLFSWIGVEAPAGLNNVLHNPGYGARQAAVARFFNRFLKSKLNEGSIIPDVRLPFTGKIDAGKLRLILQSKYSRKILGAKPMTDETVQNRVKSVFNESNRALNERYGLSLETLCPEEYF